MNPRVIWAFCLMVGIAFCGPAMAEDAPEETPETRYIDLTPPFVTNYGGPGRIKFIKAEVSIRVEGQDDFREVMYHAPSIRHALVMLLSKQTDDTIGTPEGKEALRVEALNQVKALMLEEEGRDMVTDLVFSTFFMGT